MRNKLSFDDTEKTFTMSFAEKVEVIDGYPKGYNEGYNVGIEEGKQSAYDEYWDSFQDNGNKKDYSYSFGGSGWNDVTFNPKYPIYPSGANSMFYNSQITDLTKVTLDFKKNSCGGFYAMCRGCTSLVAIGDIYTLGAANVGEIFYNCSALVSVGTVTVKDSTTYSLSFYNCKSLVDITFAGTIGQNLDIRYSPLTKKSITSIMEHLSAAATGKTLTLKKTAVNEAFETSEGAADGSTSAEWTTLTGTKTNWTISLV